MHYPVPLCILGSTNESFILITCRRDLGGGAGRQMPSPQYFFNLRIAFLVTELTNNK
jgi:hypothetical protein